LRDGGKETDVKHPLRAVLVGCGSISAAWLGPAKEIAGLEIVGLVDVVEASARQRAAEFELPRAVIGTDLNTVLDQTAPDLVFDCTVPSAHEAVTLSALAHGCHVLGEKPLATSMEAAHRMVAAAQASGKVYAVMQNRRFLPTVNTVKDYLRRGELGPLTTVTSDFFLAAHFGGFREHMEHVLLTDMAIHTFDMARFLTGADPVSVYCKEWNPPGSWYAHGASALAIFELSGGLVYSYRGSWCSEGCHTSWESQWRLVGTEGSLTWDGHEAIAAEVVTGRGGFTSQFASPVIPPHSGPRLEGHGGLLRDFIACLQSGRTPETICTDNLKSLAMVFGAIESAERGLPVLINS
jgi:predicted dehydrogenase